MREKSTSSGLNNLISVSTNPAAGHNDHADTNSFNLADCTTQRRLNDTGGSQSRTCAASLTLRRHAG
jgi:hypothetical protein